MIVSRHSIFLRAAALAAPIVLISCSGAGLKNPLPPANSLAFRSGGVFDTASSYAVVHSFDGGLGGGNAETPIVFDAQGNAYGTTVQGGHAGCGIVFRLHRATSGRWQETVLHNFSCFADGKNPHGGAIVDSQGNIFGTTTSGGVSGGCTGDGCGVIFEILRGGKLSVLYTFQGKNDGSGPGSPLTIDSAGNLYGATPDNGKYGDGTIFTLEPINGSWHFQAIHQFTGGNDGSTGSLGPILYSGGALYGVTELGGANSAGIAYKLERVSGTWKFTTLYAFKGEPDGANPYGGLIERGGKFYGTTYYGGTDGSGSVFELTPETKTYGERVVYSFKGGTDGSFPTTTLFAASSGTLYGTTSMGGTSSCDCGSVFSLAQGTFAEHVLHRFGGSGDGQNPYDGLAQLDGLLYSSTVDGGTSGNGTIFSIAP